MTDDEQARPPVEPLVTEVRGTRAGLLVLLGVAALNLGNAAFHLLSARLLGPGQYADVLSLVTAQGLIALPFGGLQYAVARWVAEDAARGDEAALGASVRRSTRLTFAVGLTMAALATAAAPFIGDALGVRKAIAVVLTTGYLLPALLAPTMWGVAQGLQRFGLISSSLVTGVVTRIALIVALIPLGLGVGGAMGATAVAAVVTLLVPLPLVARWYRRGRGVTATHSTTTLLASMGPVMVGSLAITSLTTIDVIAAKVALPSHVAGIYGAASFIGRLLLYLPMTIATVLLPKVTSRAAVDRDTKEIFHASLAVTAAFSLAGTAVLVAVPRLVIHATYGAAYDKAVPLIGVFGLAMTMYALLNVQFVYHVGHGRWRMAWLLLGGSIAQILLYTVVHGSTYQLVGANLATAAALLVIHEIAVEPSLFAGLKWAFRLLGNLSKG